MDGSIAVVSHQESPSLVVRPETQPEVSKYRAEAPTLAVKEKDNRGETEHEGIAQAVELANTVAELLDKKISLSYDERINRVIVTVIKESTEEVIRQIPAEEIVKLTAKLREDVRGFLFNHLG